MWMRWRHYYTVSSTVTLVLKPRICSNMIVILWNNLNITQTLCLLMCDFYLQETLSECKKKKKSHPPKPRRVYTKRTHLINQLLHDIPCFRKATSIQSWLTMTLLPGFTITQKLKFYHFHKQTSDLFKGKQPYLLQYLCISQPFNMCKMLLPFS